MARCAVLIDGAYDERYEISRDLIEKVRFVVALRPASVNLKKI